MQAEVASARQDWEAGYRRLLEETRDEGARERVLGQVDVVTEELRKRLGGAFTLAELTDAYATADAWARDAVAERAPAPGSPRTLALVEDAAFHLYARGAIDYAP